MQHARWLLSTTCALALSGCSFQLYDKEKDDQAKALKNNLAGVSFDETFATAQANQDAITDATTTASQRLAELDAKRKLFVVLSTSDKLGDEDGLQGALATRWTELMCGDAATECATPDQVAAEWRARFCAEPSPFNEACASSVPVRFSRIVDLGLTDYDPNSLRIPGLRLADKADNVLIASGRTAPICVAKPVAEGDFGKAVRMLPPPEPAIPSTAEFTRSLPEAAASQTAPIYDGYIRICQETLEAQYQLTWLVGASAESGIGMAWTEWKRAQDDVTRLQLETRQRQAEYQADNAAYQQALRELKDRLPHAEDKTKELLGKATKALDAVAAVNDFGVAFAADERLKSLREIIATLGGASKTSGADKSALTDDVRANLAAIASLPHLIDDSAKLFEAADEARLSPLVLELSYQEQVLLGAKRRIADLEAQAELKRQIYFAAVAEAGKIGFAQERVADAAGLDGFATQPLYELMRGADSAPNDGQAALLDALTAYYESQVKFYAAQDKLAFDEAAASFQRNLNENQIALNEWLALSKSDSDILAAYFASGIKPEELASLLVQLIGLGSIGVGVNR